MNNFDLHNRAQELSDTCSSYNLAKSLVLAQEKFWAMDKILEQLEVDLEHFHMLVNDLLSLHTTPEEDQTKTNEIDCRIIKIGAEK